MFGAIGIGIDFDFLDSDGATNKWKDGYKGLGPDNRLGAFNKDKINLRSTDENDNIQDTSWKDFSGKFTPQADDSKMFVAKAGAQLELFTQVTIPLFCSVNDLANLRFLDEININGKAYLNLGARLSILDFASWAAGKIGRGQDAVNWLQNNKIAKRILKLFDSGIELNFNTLVCKFS